MVFLNIYIDSLQMTHTVRHTIPLARVNWQFQIKYKIRAAHRPAVEISNRN